jgi:plastocyanin
LTKVHSLFGAQIVTAAALTALAGCGGGGSGSPTTPGGTGGGSPGPSGATITISGGRVTPSQVTVAVGQSVTFVNNDGRIHNMASDPHPVHTDCPQINAVGVVSNNQTELTNAFPTARSCGFHDHDDPDNGNLKGRITIQ